MSRATFCRGAIGTPTGTRDPSQRQRPATKTKTRHKDKDPSLDTRDRDRDRDRDRHKGTRHYPRCDRQIKLFSCFSQNFLCYILRSFYVI